MIELMFNLSKIIGNIQQHPVRPHDTAIKPDIKYLLICSAQFILELLMYRWIYVMLFDLEE